MNRAVRGDDRPATVKVAAIQCSSDLGDVVANSAKLTELVRQAAAGGAKIVVLPEAAITGYISQDLAWNWHVPGRPIDRSFRGRDPAPIAQTVPGPATEHFCALAMELEIYLTIPLVERVDRPLTRSASEITLTRSASEASTLTRSVSEESALPPAFFNTACLAAPDGRLVTHYRKLHPWPPVEQSWATPGDRGLAVFDTEYGRVGLAICFDIHTLLADYAAQRLWALLFPTAWVDDEHPAHWFHNRLPREAAKYRHHVIGANWSVDRPQRWRGYGFSTVISAEGQVLATAKSLVGSEIVFAELAVAESSGSPK